MVHPKLAQAEKGVYQVHAKEPNKRFPEIAQVVQVAQQKVVDGSLGVGVDESLEFVVDDSLEDVVDDSFESVVGIVKVVADTMEAQPIFQSLLADAHIVLESDPSKVTDFLGIHNWERLD